MASKRKSTVPCMIPPKPKHVREEIILGSLPELLPTIPEDGILSISGDECGHAPHGSSCPETQKGGTYGCVGCRFESRDLNYFLDHVHTCHVDFRAQPTFYCLDCGVSVERFEALALHNANSHPRILEGVVTASLSVSKRDGVTTVEQSLFTDDRGDAGGSLSKAALAKTVKAKAEHKKVVVSHTVEVRQRDVISELPNGAAAMPRTTVSHVITTVSNQILHQHSPSLYSTNSSKDLPKVMIPLSSIPTYDAAMDTSSFLKTSFGKFPYPTKAELCYLTVVSEFPEEQIKLWFTAQRLKQGISWSPEEIEEARRKMFNTVFQGGAPQKQPAAFRHVKHLVSHHTVAAHLGSKGPNFRKVPPGTIIAAQASVSTNPNVTRVSYSTPVVRATETATKGAEATAEPEGSNRVDVAGGSGGADGAETENLLDRAGPTISNHPEHCPPDTDGELPGSNESNTSTGAAEPDNAEKPDREADNGGMAAEKPGSSNQNHASNSLPESTGSYVTTGGITEDEAEDSPVKGMSILQQLIREEDPAVEGSPELGADPFKISFRRLKRSEAEEPQSEVNVSKCPPSSGPWSNKTPWQLHVLRQAFSGTRWPSSTQYEELSVQTGLPKSEVVRWFSDSRYSHKNGQLKWLETYRQSPAEPEEAEAAAGPQAAPPTAKKKPMEQEADEHLEMEAGRMPWQDSCPAPPAPPDRAEESAPPDLWSQRGDEHQLPADVAQDR